MARSAFVTHQARGRVRIRVTGTRKEVGAALAALEDQVASNDGVRAVSTDTRTGSALVLFDPEQLHPDDIVTLAREAHDALRDLLPQPVGERVDRAISRVAARVTTGFVTADSSVLGATGGVVDLRMLLPLGLAGLSVRQLTRSGPALAQIPWYVLAYYAFDSFLKLHPGRQSGDGVRPGGLS